MKISELMLCPPHESSHERHESVGRLFRQKMTAILEGVQLEVRQLGRERLLDSPGKPVFPPRRDALSD